MLRALDNAPCVLAPKISLSRLYLSLGAILLGIGGLILYNSILVWPIFEISGGMLIFIGAIILVAGCGLRRDLSAVPKLNDMIAAYYPQHDLDNWNEKVQELLAGKLKMDPYCVTTIGISPDWKASPERTGYFMFNLHTLRFVSYLVRSGEDGNMNHLDLANDIVRSWATENQLRSSENFNSCFRQPQPDCIKSSGPDCYAWADEHAVAWRAILLAYLWRVSIKNNVFSKQDKDFIINLASQHGSYLSRPSSYRYPHNHGLNNALGLLAIATSFPKIHASRYWCALAISRAEQQMRDNVSEDGIHLEQSGFYHFYTLRSFKEIARIVTECGLSMSEEYLVKIERMVKAGVAMITDSGVVYGLPMSDPTLDMRSVVSEVGEDPDTDLLAGEAMKSLAVFPEGGFVFFKASEKSEVEVTFHTKIIKYGRGGQDALGFSVRAQGLDLICLPSKLSFYGEKGWLNFFNSAAAHNTLIVDGLEQGYPKISKSFLYKLLHSYKIESICWKTGLIDILGGLREFAQCTHVPPVSMAQEGGGRITAWDSNENHEYVIAEADCYKGIQFQRTIARIDGRIILVRDVINGNKEYKECRQLFHVAPAMQVVIDGGKGKVLCRDSVIFRFFQLNPRVQNGRVVSGQLQPDVLGWYSDNPKKPPRPTSCIIYSETSQNAELILLICVGSEPVECNAVLSETGLRCHTEIYVNFAEKKKLQIACHEDRVDLIYEDLENACN